MKKLLHLAIAFSFIGFFNESCTSTQVTVYEARLQPSKTWMVPYSIFGPAIRGISKAPSGMSADIDGTGRSMSKVKIEKDLKGTTTLTVTIKGINRIDPPPLPDYDPPPVAIVLQCGDGYAI
jgi:hypothetical protein